MHLVAVREEAEDMAVEMNDEPPAALSSESDAARVRSTVSARLMQGE